MNKLSLSFAVIGAFFAGWMSTPLLAQQEGLVVTGSAPSPLENKQVREAVSRHLGNLPEGILKERTQLEHSINSKEIFGDQDPQEQRLLNDLSRLYPKVKLYDNRILMPQPSSTLEEPTMISSALGALVYSVDLTEAKNIGQRSQRRPGDTGVFLQPIKKGKSTIVKLVIGIKTPEQRLSPLKPLIAKVSKKIKWQYPIGTVRIAPVYRGDFGQPLKGEFNLNYYAPRPENKNYAHLGANIYLTSGTIKGANLWHIQVFKRNSKKVLKTFVADAKDILSLAEFNAHVKNKKWVAKPEPKPEAKGPAAKKE